MSTNISNYIPVFREKTITTITWGAGGTTSTITDPQITLNSQVELWVTGSTPQAGQWSYTYSVGSLLLTSSSSESSSLPISYYIN
jgi:hypothetical protein